MHDFWNMESGLEQRHELQNFVKNTGIIAGLLILSAVHPGKYKIGN
jgi:putative oxidoreductase